LTVSVCIRTIGFPNNTGEWLLGAVDRDFLLPFRKAKVRNLNPDIRDSFLLNRNAEG